VSVQVTKDRGGRLLLRVTCNGCTRSAASDFLTPTELCRLIAWDCDLGVAFCLQCQRRRHRPPEFARWIGRVPRG